MQNHKVSPFFDGHLDISPPVTDEHLAKLPARRGVALLLAESDHPITLLPAADIRSRVSARMRNPEEDPRQKMPDLRGITRRVEWKLTGGHFETDLCFLELARELWPDGYPKMLAFKKAAFVHVNPAEEFPRFVRTDDVFGQTGPCLGPFPSGRAADRFVEAVQEAFDLCRDYRCLRQSPRGVRCSYGQMGRCLCPCDGSLAMDAYRKAVAEAADYVAGSRSPLRDALTSQMKQAAAGLQFEKAATLKARLERLSAIDHEDFRHVAPVEEFRFLLVQPGVSARKMHVFAASGGQIVQLPNLDYPLSDGPLQVALETLSHAPTTPLPRDGAALWRMALVSHYLYCSPERSGLVLRYRPDLTARSLAEMIEDQAVALRLVKPRRPPGEAPAPDPLECGGTEPKAHDTALDRGRSTTEGTETTEGQK